MIVGSENKRGVTTGAAGRVVRRGARGVIACARAENRVALAAVFCLALLLWCGAGEARANGEVSLAEYRERTSRAAVAVDALTYPDEDEATSEAERAAAERLTIDEVRRDVAGVSAVVWGGRRFELNNDELVRRLDEYEENTGREPAGRREVVRRLAEQLQALEDRLAEAEAAAAPDADATKGRLAQILQRPEYNVEPGRGGAARGLWQRFIEWLFSRVPRPSFARSDSIVSQVIVIAIVALMIVALAWKLLPLVRGRSGAKRDVLNLEGRRVLGERLRAGQRAADLLREAERLAREGEARAAIRKAYVALLCELGERRIVLLADHKTNRDYLDAVRGRAALSRQMYALTGLYERHWYGDRPASATEWGEFRRGYDRALASLASA